MNFIGFRVIGKRIAAIRFMLKDKTVPFWKKLLIALGVFYVLSPIDLIPVAVFPIAWLDDLILWLGILWYLRDELDRYWLGEKSVDLSRKFYGKDIVEGVEYEVRDSGSQEQDPKNDENDDKE